MDSKNLLQITSHWGRGSLGDSKKSIFLIGGTQQVPYVTGLYLTAAILSPDSSGPSERQVVRVRVFFFFSNDVPALKNERKWEKASIPGHRPP